ncbi:uncharacterized protein CIMG_08730 [Coccidioides immitis RS]|uniref:Uncharacterized protein n=1 Tax=Coccidioides immitis (strain RS) TaxID=246410 RepID=J3K632_COCIM|nr:uncharacterized protein CIMG_08730 [Coccidioides immitis RS]EAS29984.3 hypothetical protein CIMG_08730 [Coccidioides immitis RS]
MSQPTSGKASRPSTPVPLPLLPSQVVELHHVAGSARKRYNNSALKQSRSHVHPESLIEIHKANERRYRERLQQECNAHAITRNELESERKFHQDAAEANAQLHHGLLQAEAAQAILRQQLSIEQGAHRAATAEQTLLRQQLGAEREAHQATAADLAHAVRWCHWVDSLVDVKRLEENNTLHLDDKSRQLGDIILDVQNKMEEKYAAYYQQQDDLISELQQRVNVYSQPVEGFPRTTRSAN